VFVAAAIANRHSDETQQSKEARGKADGAAAEAEQHAVRVARRAAEVKLAASAGANYGGQLTASRAKVKGLALPSPPLDTCRPLNGLLRWLWGCAARRLCE
jgi:hypothetical protein